MTLYLCFCDKVMMYPLLFNWVVTFKNGSKHLNWVGGAGVAGRYFPAIFSWECPTFLKQRLLQTHFISARISEQLLGFHFVYVLKFKLPGAKTVAR